MPPSLPASLAAMHAPDWMPLTEAQEGLWYAQRLAPANPSFNPAHCTILHSPLNVERFCQAVDRTLAEAQALQLQFRAHAAGPQQRLVHGCTPGLEVRDLRHLPEPQALAQAHDWMRCELQRPVDPTREALARQVLFLCGPAQSLWFQRVHHLAADGYGMALIEGRAIRLYRALLDGTPPREAPLAPLAPVWAEDQAWRTGPARTRAHVFWRDYCAGHMPAASIAPRAGSSSNTCIRKEQLASDSLVRALQALEAATQVSWPDILTTLTAAFVARHLGPAECVVGVPTMGRLGSASARAVTTVMNVMPWICALDESLPMAGLLAAAARSLRTLRRHSRYQAEQLRRDLALPGGVSRLHGPIVNVLPFDAPYAAAGLDASQAVLCTGPVDDLTLSLRAAPDGAGLRIEIEANPALYRDHWVQACLTRLAVFLEGALKAPRLAEVPTLTPAEYTRWEQDPNRTQHPVPAGTLWSRIGARLRQAPQDTPLSDAEGTWTCAQIDAWTAAAAHRLRACGTRPGARVAVALPRSALQVLCLLAILRSGAAYLPLDPGQPPARLRQILGEAEPCALIGPADLCAGLPVHHLDAATLGLPGETPGASLDAGPEDPAYVIYTSGSTGTPKGVVVPHAAIVNRLEWMRAHYDIGPDDRILYKTPYTFDVSVWELFLPFLSGAALVVAPPEAHRDPAWLCRLIGRAGISIVHFVPSMLAAVLDEPAAHGLRPRLVFCSGEALPTTLRDRFHGIIRAQLHNLYGPTEAAVDVSWWPAGRDDRSDPLPIGWPVWNTRLHVLDDWLRPVPAGTPGQLYLGGRQLASGYLNRPDLTAERFIPAPAGFPDQRLYATGDLATRREDGAILYLGRLDHQVKLRGQRIELGEIEAVLVRHPAVSQVAVLAREDVPGDPRLVAYAVTAAGKCERDLLEAHVAARLPSYMVPSAWVFLPALPVTANGKLDRRALPAPALPPGHGTGDPACTATERRVATAFRDILGLAGLPGRGDDFFALGGHSLPAARLALNLAPDAGGEVSLGTVFQYPTVARLAAHLDTLACAPRNGTQAGFGPVVTLREAPGRPALFCIHPAGGLSWCYATLARALAPARAVHGLQASALAPDGSPAARTLTELAERYADRIQAVQPTGPCHLAGWSVGGILAQEIAVTLRARGRTVGVVALLDAYPCELWHDQPDPSPEDLCKALLHIAGADPGALAPGRHRPEDVIAFLRAHQHPLGALSDTQINAVFSTVSHTNRLVRAHTHRYYAGPVLHFQATLERRAAALDPAAWRPHTGTLTVTPVPATHAGLPGADAVACMIPTLNAALVAADGGWLDPDSFVQRSLHKEAI